MSNDPLVSDLVGAIIRAFRRYEKVGVDLSPRSIDALIRNLRTIQELAENVEQELAIQMELVRIGHCRQQRALSYSSELPDDGGGNVVRLPTRFRLVRQHSDGGDAA
jgi:hypothetical protein